MGNYGKTKGVTGTAAGREARVVRGPARGLGRMGSDYRSERQVAVR